MISLEMAKKLRDAGLEWEPALGDFLYWDISEYTAQIDVLAMTDIDSHMNETMDNIEEGNWLLAPRLDQLLAEITEKWQWNWRISLESDVKHMKDSPFSIILQRPKRWHKLENKDWASCFATRGTTPDDAAASALLWILERGKE